MTVLMYHLPKLIFAVIAFTSCLAFFASCNGGDSTGAQEEVSVAPLVDTIFYKVMVDNLRMRDAPNLQAETLTLLPQGVIVRTWGERSLREDEIRLRGTIRRDFWYRARYQEQDGWIFGGALDKVSDDPASNSLIIPERQFGPVLATDSEIDVINRLGKENVTRTQVSIGEGESVAGTIIFPGTSREVTLLWTEQNFEDLHEARSQRADAPWATDLGIKIGSSLKQVEKINGRPFRLSGFQWDYAGTTTGWNQGKISESMVLVFAEPERFHSDLIGDQMIDSDNARMQRANPRVSMLRVLF